MKHTWPVGHREPPQGTWGAVQTLFVHWLLPTHWPFVKQGLPTGKFKGMQAPFEQNPSPLLQMLEFGSVHAAKHCWSWVDG